MKITNIELINAKRGFEELLEKELPARVSLKLYSLAESVHDSLVAFTKAQQKLVKDYNIDNKGITADPTKQEEANTQFNELANAEIELPVEKVIVPLYFKGQELGIKPSTIALLKKLVEIELPKEG